MGKMFWGFFFAILDFNITINQTASIGLLPSFIGYILIIMSLNELDSYSDRFSRVKPIAIAVCIVSAIQYALNSFGIYVQLGIVGAVIDIVMAVLTLYIPYAIICGIKDIEIKFAKDLNSQNLMTFWKIILVSCIIVNVFVLLAYVPAVSALSSILVIVAGIVYLVGCIVFLINIYKSKKAFEFEV